MMVLSPGSDPTLVTLNNFSLSYAPSGISQGAVYDSGTFTVTESGTLTFTVSESGRDLYGAFGYTETMVLAFILQENGTTGTSFQLAGAGMVEDGVDNTSLTEQGYTRMGSYSQSQEVPAPTA